MQIDLRHGDCVEVMKTLADASVDAVVTDPPYELGFMGKGWDASGIAYSVEMWREVLRVLKPGGHLLAFGGTRTYHRMAVAIEDAGFEIRDSLHWIYGCLSEDTEILVNGEWAHYSKAIEGSLALCYDVEHEAYAWRSIERLYVYAYDDTAYRIESGATDQIVSRNHRCLVEREGKWKFVVAEELAREQEARVPVLEALPAMLNAIRVQQSNTSGSEHALREVSDGAAESPAPEGSDEDQKGRLCGVRDGDGKTGGVAQTGETADMLAQVQRGGSWRRIGETRTQGACCVDGCKPRIIPTEDDRSGESSVEGRGDVQAEQGELRRAKVCPVSTGVSDDGAQGRLRHGASVGGGDGLGPMSCACGGGSPRRSRHEEQRAVEPHAVRVESGAQVVRGEGFTGTTLARVTPIHYVGKVWCVKVPTGAFVARRNGKVFVTGNSGFPKSLDVSKAIDKAAGAEREVVGTKLGLPGYSLTDGKGGLYGDGFGANGTGAAECAITAPATDAAKQWSGWGTALKPAHEPVVVARKPLDGTVAANVQAHGTGALNIDGTRIATTDNLNGGTYSGGKRNPAPGDTRTSKAAGRYGEDGRLNPEDFKQPEGRWPPNLLLSHTPECGEACAEDCPVAEMDRQSGTSKSTGGRTVKRSGGGNVGSGKASEKEWSNDDPGYGDSGGASRFFPVFRYQAKASRSERGTDNKHPTVKPVALMRWLVRLVTPPGGVVLEPFMGSGTTGVACVQEGFSFVGIEHEVEYFEICKARIAAAQAESPAQKELFSA